MKAIVGVDIGSSALKAVLVRKNVDGSLSEDVEIFHEPLRSRVADIPEGHFEENPVIIREQVFEILRKNVASASEKDLTIEAIAFTGQMHGGLIVDRNLEPLSHFITWQDKRGDEIQANGKSYAEELRERKSIDPSGVSIHTGFLITSLYWLKTQNKIPDKSAYVLGIYDWLTSIVVDRAVTDSGSAAAWAMFDPIEKKWRNELIESIGISQSFLPEVREPGAFLGTINEQISKELRLPSTIRIHASIGDTQAAYLGSECRKDQILLNFGTGSQSMWETTNTQATDGVDIRYLHSGRFLACAPTLAGGEAYRIVATFFQDVARTFAGNEIPIPEILSIMDRLALSSESKGLKMDPIFSGSKFRLIRERGFLGGITSNNFSAAPLVRALVEGMMEEVATPYFQRGEFRHSGLVGAGSGLKHNPSLCAQAETRFGLPLRLARFQEAAATGAAMLCAGALVE